MERGVRMDKRAQGLPITTIIIAILGLVVLVILFAITTGRLAIFGRATAECQGTCVGEYTGASPAVDARQCDPSFERPIVGTYIKAGQAQNTPPEQTLKCTRCCVSLT
jgi:hypothetical protein